MRVVNIPQMSTGEVANESDVQAHGWIQDALRAFGPMHSYLWLRIGSEDAGLDRKDVTCLYHEIERDFYRQMAMANVGRLSEFFSWGHGLYPVDAVFTSRVGIAPLLTVALGMTGAGFSMPVVITEPRVYAPGEDSHNVQSETMFAVRAAGYATCYGLYYSKWEKESALTTASMFVKEGVLRGFEDRSFVCEAPVRSPFETPPPRRPGRKTIGWFGRLNSNKRYREVLDAYRMVVQRRTDTTVWVHAGTGAFDRMIPRDSRWHRTSERLPRDEYLRLMSNVHVGAYMSRDEGANVTVQEMILNGVVMVLPRRRWVERLFWPVAYPFVAESENELVAMLDWVLDNYEQATATLEPVRQMIRRDHSWDGYVQKVERLVEAVERHRKPAPYRVFRNIVRDMTSEHDLVSFTSALGMRSKDGRPSALRSASNFSCYAAVRDLDVYGNAVPLLRRPESSHSAEKGDPLPCTQE